MLQLARKEIQLTNAERSQLRAGLLSDAPEFVTRFDQLVEVLEIAQPWFRQHRILDVQFPLPHPARRVYVVAGPREMRVLSAHIESLQKAAATDPPLNLADPENAEAYAAYGNGWTRIYALGEFKLSAFDDIPFHADLDKAEQAVVDSLRARFGTRIQPEVRTQSDAGWAFHSWWLAMGTLVERQLVVPLDGKLLRNDVVHAEHLPAPVGTHWRMIGGRYTPVG